MKIWSTDQLDGKSGFFKSIFTYDKQTALAANRHSTVPDNNSSIQPSCTAFYDRTSLAILGHDFRFHVIDFNSNRTQYHLYTHEKLFKPSVCAHRQPKNARALNKSYFYYLNKSFKNLNQLAKESGSPVTRDR